MFAAKQAVKQAQKLTHTHTFRFIFPFLFRSTDYALRSSGMSWSRQLSFTQNIMFNSLFNGQREANIHCLMYISFENKQAVVWYSSIVW